jgi:hypothetical protein
MTEIDIDHETTQAVDAITRRIDDRGDADTEVLAREIMTDLRARGWRPTAARRTDWRDQFHGGAGMPVSEETQALLAAAKARQPGKDGSS